MSHSYGFSNLVTPLLLHGIPLILATSVFPEVFRQIVSTTPQLTVPAVPAVWRAWQEAGVLKGGLRLAVSAGAPLPIELEQAVFRTSGIKIHNFYGATESGGIAYDRSPEPRGDASFVGTPLNGVQVSVDSERCLNIASDAVGSSYWPDSDASLAGGRYVSADLGEIQDGRVFLRGRKNDLIHVAGRKVAPEEIEEILRQHPHVQNCLVFGIPADDVDRGEWIVACVVRREPVPEDALRQFLLKKIPAWQIPREWRWLETLDVNARGKLSRAEWRSRLFPGTRLPTIGSA